MRIKPALKAFITLLFNRSHLFISNNTTSAKCTDDLQVISVVKIIDNLNKLKHEND